MPKRWLSLLVVLVGLSFGHTAKADRLRDLVDVVGARDNQLIGYGVVVGLNGTGDDVSAPFAMQSLKALLTRLGVQVSAKQLRLKNVAAVVITANIPAFSRPGQKLDIVVSSIGNSSSLRGGVLLQAPMRGADRRVYAVAQGPLLIGGFSASGASGSSSKTGITTTGRIPGGALVEREIKSDYAKSGVLTLSLRSPDFQTAQRIADAVNKELGKGSATPLDGGAVSVKPPKKLRGKPVKLLAQIGDIEVTPASVARVVINERTGTIVAGGDVRLSPVAISQGGITINIKEKPRVSQPEPLAAGKTEVVTETDIETTEQAPPALTYLEGAASLADVAQALSVFGVTPRELASILQALRSAGALRAEVIVQ